MRMPPQAQLTDKKYAEIQALIKQLGVDLGDIEEKFVKGGGRGGQKVNKSTNAVQLKHVSGVMVKYHKHRVRAMNRVLALRELMEKLNPESKRELEMEKMRKQKQRRKRRSGLK